MDQWRCAADSPVRLSGAPVRQPALVAITNSSRRGGLAASVNVGGVDEVDPGVDRSPDQRLGFRGSGLGDRPIAATVAEGHRSKGKSRNDQAGVA
jgi:hypothetical protein